MLEEEDNKKELILASASPRRKEIFDLFRVDFKVVKPGNFEERQYKNPYKTVVWNSIAKTRSVYDCIRKQNFKKTVVGYNKYNKGRQFLIVGFDTIVYAGNKSMGKPLDREQAIDFLKILSGKTHRVITGVCVLESISGKFVYDTETTKVKFRKLSIDEIKMYVDRENVLDKAGAYNVLGYGSLLVEKISGCFYNIAGVPVTKFLGLLREFGFNVFC
ncbi:MAG: Maf family nucleotide pyrophosphatase [Actinomycetota bacterium]|nr:Maf family nucleotide pyrophosphatase [Actinomycetota bacterium]